MFESVTYWSDGTQYTVPAEPTDHPQLYVTPTVMGGHIEDGWFLLHRPTGRCVVTSRPCGELRRIAAILVQGGLDWTSADLAHYGDSTYRDAWIAAVREVEAVDPSPEAEPKTCFGIERQALPLLKSTLEQFQLSWDKTVGKDSIEMKLPDGSFNPEWYLRIEYRVNIYSVAYLLAVLIRVDPYIADQAAAHLADDLDAGDSLGEWVYRWSEELAAGRPLTLHGVPTPTPTDLLTPVQS